MTLEQLVKRAVPIGMSLVTFTLGERSRVALVRVSPRGKVSYLTEPQPEDMYSTWRTVNGDKCAADGIVHVWAARDHSELMAMFKGSPVASIALQRQGEPA